MSPPAVPSPCNQVCTMDPATGFCAGCLRTLDEIAAWGGLDETGKRQVWERLMRRRAELPRSPGDRDGPDAAARTALAASASGEGTHR